MSSENEKEHLLNEIQLQLDMRIAALEQAVEAAKESRDSDTKSSAGDKYETGREMAQQEMDKQQAQLAKTRLMKLDLSRINPEQKMSEAGFGSLVSCDSGNYFLSVALGKVDFGGSAYFCL